MRGDFTTLEASIRLGDELARLATEATPGIPLVAQGHSFGAVATLWKLVDDSGPYRAAVVVSGAALVPVAGLVDADSTFEIAPTGLSTDPLAFVDADGGPLARELDRGWDAFGAKLPNLTLPTLAVHGGNDPIARFIDEQGP